MLEGGEISLGQRANELANILSAVKKVDTHAHLDDLIFVAQEIGALPKNYSFDFSNFILYCKELEYDLIKLTGCNIVDEMYPSSIYITERGKAIASTSCEELPRLSKLNRDELNTLAKILMISCVYNEPTKSTIVRKKAFDLFRISANEYKRSLGLYFSLRNQLGEHK